jgi:hypothetical protein
VNELTKSRVNCFSFPKLVVEIEQERSSTTTTSRGAPQSQLVGGVKAVAEAVAVQPEYLKVLPELKVRVSGKLPAIVTEVTPAPLWAPLAALSLGMAVGKEETVQEQAAENLYKYLPAFVEASYSKSSLFPVVVYVFNILPAA